LSRKSEYGDRDTVGSIYLKAQEDHKNDAPIINGDLTNELMKSFVDDLNACILSKPNGDNPFYITIHEKKDLLMPNAILRRVIPSGKRPFPEDDTVVFYTDPIKNETLFCWCLPHYVEMDNIVRNENLFDQDYVDNIRAWLKLDLTRFGFMKDQIGNWIPDPNFKYHKMGEKAQRKHVKLYI
jgi:hypothetical protein